jgi:hypothetical protein
LQDFKIVRKHTYTHAYNILEKNVLQAYIQVVNTIHTGIFTITNVKDVLNLIVAAVVLEENNLKMGHSGC